MENKKASDMAIEETNKWFIERILSKTGFRKVEPHFSRIIKEEVSLKSLENGGIYIPECNLGNYIAFRTEFYFLPFVDHQQIWFRGSNTDIFVSGFIILPREFMKKTRPVYSVKLLLENYPKVPNFPMFSFPLKRKTTHSDEVLFKVLKEDFNLFKFFLKDLKKKLLEKEKTL